MLIKNSQQCNLYFWFKFDLGQKYYTPQVRIDATRVRPHDLQIITVHFMSLRCLLLGQKYQAAQVRPKVPTGVQTHDMSPQSLCDTNLDQHFISCGEQKLVSSIFTG